MTTSFWSWLFVKRDIDGLIIGLLISKAVSKLLTDMTDGVLKPITTAVIPFSDSEVDIKLMNREVKLKVGQVFNSILVLILNVFMAYVLVRLSIRYFPNNNTLNKKASQSHNIGTYFGKKIRVKKTPGARSV